MPLAAKYNSVSSSSSPIAAVKHIVTKSEPRTYTIQEIDGRRAEDVYTKELGILPENITEQTMVNPLGRVIGDETYIISIKSRP